jgi:CheY-like chemotaxis protein
MADESGSSPKPAREQSSTSPFPAAPNPSVPQRLNLLLAEDNLPDAILVREAIRSEALPIEVHIVADGEQAINFIAHAEEDPAAVCPHIVLLDLNLPKRDGFEVLRRLRSSELCKTVPVLIFTSSDSPRDRNQATELGAAYFRKPPSYEEFLKLGTVLKQLLTDRGLL